MPALSASVVLCTCEGERFLPEQLASLRAQTRTPLEILAQDDASTDGTVAILEAEKSLLVRRNPQRLGFAANFASVLPRARGDVIFLCDQDDVWERDKLETMLGLFERDPGLDIACSEATKIDENSHALPGLVLAGNFLGESQAADWERGRALTQLVRKNAVPGMTVAFRASFRDQLLPLPPGWEHDYWILLVAAGLGKRIAVEGRPLVRYRQHRGQVIGGEKSISERWKRAETQALGLRNAEAERWIPLLERLRAAGAPSETLRLLREKQAHLARRGAFSRSRLVRLAEIGGELLRGGYHRFDSGLSSALKDLLSR